MVQAWHILGQASGILQNRTLNGAAVSLDDKLKEVAFALCHAEGMRSRHAVTAADECSTDHKLAGQSSHAVFLLLSFWLVS